MDVRAEVTAAGNLRAAAVPRTEDLELPEGVAVSGGALGAGGAYVTGLARDGGVSLPPWPLVVLYALVQVVPLVESSIR